MAGHQYNAAISAVKEKGVLAGVRVEKSEVGTPGEFEAMEDSELLAAIRERFARLSLTPPDAESIAPAKVTVETPDADTRHQSARTLLSRRPADAY